jgi:hypothetical protein
VSELHADPGKGCVQIRFGEIGGEAANVHAKWGRGTLRSHEDIVTTTDAARFVPSAAMCLPSQSEAQQTMARRGAMVMFSIGKCGSVSPRGAGRQPAAPRR